MKRAAKPARGGARAGAGRKPLGAARMQRYAVILDESTVERLRAAGQGNLSAGIRSLAASDSDPTTT